MKLNQVIAIEKGTKAKTQQDVDQVFKAAQKPSLFEGFAKTYQKKSDEDEDVPAQRQNVQALATRALREIADRWVPLFNVTAQKDFANCEAKADVKIGEKVVLTQAPVTYLLFVEKQLTDLYTILGKFPVLDPAEKWTFDHNTEQWHSEPVLTTRTKKVQKGIVLYPHTAEHPAQTQLITEDVSVGTYEHVKFSGALPEPRKRTLLRRIEELLNAVKAAREEANGADAPKVDAGSPIFDWLLAD